MTILLSKQLSLARQARYHYSKLHLIHQINVLSKNSNVVVHYNLDENKNSAVK